MLWAAFALLVSSVVPYTARCDLIPLAAQTSHAFSLVAALFGAVDEIHDKRLSRNHYRPRVGYVQM